MSLIKWLIKRKSDGSTSVQRAIRAAAEAVEAVQHEHEELECKGWKRKSNKRHTMHFDV